MKGWEHREAVEKEQEGYLRETPLYVYSLRNKVGFYQWQHIRREFINMLNRQRLFLTSKSILDIGCGYGNWLRFFAEIRNDTDGLVGIDVTADRIKKAKMMNKSIRFIKADATKLPFEDKSFDIISQFHTFEYLGDKEEGVISGINRVIKDGGYVIWSDLTQPDKSRGYNGYNLGEIKKLFPEYRVLDFVYSFKKVGHLLTHFYLPAISYALTDFVERLPIGDYTSLMVLLKKGVK